MKKQEKVNLDEEEINYIYVHPNVQHDTKKMESLAILEKKHDAKIIYSELVGEDWLMMSEETISPKELKALSENRTEEMH